jgi:hypothetical protein
MTEAEAAPPPPYERPVISASRLKAIGGEKGQPGCERKLAAHYLFNMKQSSSAATDFGSDLHTMAEHFQATGEVLDPEGEVARVFTAGAHLVTMCGHDKLVEYEHVGVLPDGSPYVAYIDAHSPRVGETNTLVIQDLKTTSNANFALQGVEPDVGESEELPALSARSDVDPAYALSADIQAGFYAWILLAAPAHWFAPPLPSDAHFGPKHWQWWDPAERGVRPTTTGRLRWVYFLTKGVAKSWEVNDWMRPTQAEKFLHDRIMPLVAKINALHEWHHARTTGAAPGGAPSLDEIDRTLNACRDPRRNTYGRWCGAGERDACNYDQLGTPALDLVQLKVRKMTTPQERLAALRNRTQNPAAAAAAPAPVAAAPAPAPQEAPAASPPAPPSAPTPTTSPEPQPVPTASPEAASSAPETTGQSPAGELTRGQKAAATRAAKKAGQATPPAAPPIVGNVNPPEALEALAKLTAATPAPAATAPAAAAAPTTCPEGRDLLSLLAGLAAELPPGVSVTLTGVAK